MDESHVTREEKHADQMIDNPDYRSAYYEAMSDVEREIEDRQMGVRPLCA